MSTTVPQSAPLVADGWLNRSLNMIERVGNKLPDPAVLFALLMVVVWGISWALAGVEFNEIDPRNGKPIQVINLLEGTSFTLFLTKLVSTFVNFPPLGVVLVAMLGLGVAEHTGFINAGLRSILVVTPKMLLTPVLVAVGILSHVAVDAGYVLVIPLGAVIFYAAGRHPLAGIAAAFAGVSGGFSASLFIPSSLDPLLAGLTQASARLSSHPAAADLVVNPLNNFYFTSASALLIVVIGWFLTDKVIEPRLKNTAIDGDPASLPTLDPLTAAERRGLRFALLSMLFAAAVMVISAYPTTSVWRGTNGALTHSTAPLMQSIVALIFLFFCCLAWCMVWPQRRLKTIVMLSKA